MPIAWSVCAVAMAVDKLAILVTDTIHLRDKLSITANLIVNGTVHGFLTVFLIASLNLLYHHNGNTPLLCKMQLTQ